MTHTDQCLKYQAELAAARETWQARWPNYCRKCEGAGGFDVQATRDDPPDYDVCECVDAGNCARCGFDLDIIDHEDGFLVEWYCPACGWRPEDKDDPDHQCPSSFYGCACGEEEEARAVQAMIDGIDLENTHPISELWDSLEDDDPPDDIRYLDSLQELNPKEYHDLVFGTFPPPEGDPPDADLMRPGLDFEPRFKYEDRPAPQGDGYSINGLIDDGRRPPDFGHAGGPVWDDPTSYGNDGPF